MVIGYMELLYTFEKKRPLKIYFHLFFGCEFVYCRESVALNLKELVLFYLSMRESFYATWNCHKFFL